MLRSALQGGGQGDQVGPEVENVFFFFFCCFVVGFLGVWGRDPASPGEVMFSVMDSGRGPQARLRDSAKKFAGRAKFSWIQR